ncbi:hypothetical protein Tco_0669300 [Tanacetum coccineum]
MNVTYPLMFESYASDCTVGSQMKVVLKWSLVTQAFCKLSQKRDESERDLYLTRSLIKCDPDLVNADLLNNPDSIVLPSESVLAHRTSSTPPKVLLEIVMIHLYLSSFPPSHVVGVERDKMDHVLKQHFGECLPTIHCCMRALMRSFEMLYGGKVVSLFVGFRVGDRISFGRPELIEVTNEKVAVAREKLKEAQTRQMCSRRQTSQER